MKNGPRVWAFCKIEFPGIQKPVHIFDQKSCFFKKCGNRGVGVIWPVVGVFLVCWFCSLGLHCGFIYLWLFVGLGFGVGVLVMRSRWVL